MWARFLTLENPKYKIHAALRSIVLFNCFIYIYILDNQQLKNRYRLYRCFLKLLYYCFLWLTLAQTQALAHLMAVITKTGAIINCSNCENVRSCSESEALLLCRDHK
jgi:hypothetical protein